MAWRLHHTLTQSVVHRQSQADQRQQFRKVIKRKLHAPRVVRRTKLRGGEGGGEPRIHSFKNKQNKKTHHNTVLLTFSSSTVTFTNEGVEGGVNTNPVFGGKFLKKQWNRKPVDAVIHFNQIKHFYKETNGVC